MKIQCAIIVMLINVVAFAAPGSSQQPKVENVHFSVYSGLVIVNYNLLGNSSSKYKVQLILRKGSDPSYTYFPKSLTGDIGEGKFAGQGKQILWLIDQEFPQGLPGNDYYFVVQAEEMEQSSGSQILTWVGSGVAVLAAAVTYVILSSSKSAPGNSTAVGFPAPPGRP